MTTASVQDIDTFIQLTKEKLNRERYSGGVGGFPSYVPPQPVPLAPVNQNFDYNRQQLDNYLQLSRNPSDASLQNYRQTSYAPPPQVPVAQEQFYPPRSQSPILLEQQRQREVQTNRIAKQYGDNNQQGENFFEKFGKYNEQKNKLKNELHQEYTQYMQQKNQNEYRQRGKNQGPSDEFYATLPLQGLGASKELARQQRNLEYNKIKEKLDSNDKRKSFEWWKDKNEPEIKPYSKHVGSQENVSNIKNSPFSQDQRAKSQSQFDVLSDRRLQVQNDPRAYNQPPISDLYRTKSAGSYENLSRSPPYAPQYVPQAPYSQAPIEAFGSPIPQPVSSIIDPALQDILRRPPVGPKSAVGIPTRVQFNDNVRYSDFPPNQLPFEPEPPRNNYNPNDSYRYQAPSNQRISNPATVSGRGDAAFNFSGDQNKDLKAIKMREYQEELQRQVREKQFKKQKEKEEQEKLDQKIQIENQIYNPFGRGGGGAPIRDKDGNPVADLRQVKADPGQYSPRDLPPSQAVLNTIVNNNNFPIGGSSSRSNSNELLNFGFPAQPGQQGQISSRKVGPNDEPTFARGGNGIFGEAKSDDQKKKEEKYKAELQRQIEEKQRLKALEKEKIRQEEEREQKRVEEEQRRMKAEMEEEERKKRAKEESEKQQAENAKRLAEEKSKAAQNKRVPPNKPANKRLQRRQTNDDSNQDATSPPPIVPTEFRTNSPPVPAAAKKLNGGNKPPANSVKNSFNNNETKNNENRNYSPPPPKPTVNKTKPKSNATAEYYITESRLNVSSPPIKKISSDLPDVPDGPEERAPSALITNYDNNSYSENSKNKPPQFKSNKTTPKNSDNNVIPTKPVIRKVASRPSSQVSNSEVLANLQNLKKHLNNELAEVENKRYNSNDRTTVGQLTDLHHNILNVKTPPGDRYKSEPGNYGMKTYRKDIETPPLNGGLEPRTYFRDNTILLGSNANNNDLFANDLQRQANERQINRLNYLKYENEPYRSNSFNNDQITAQNQLRLKKLRDLEDDSLSMTDPNDVLNKFISRNNRQPSAQTIHDDTWLRQPA